MRDQYAGDVSDVLKFAFLRALAGTDRTLGIAWYYAPGDDGRADGRHLEWQDEPAWQRLDPQLHAGLSMLPAPAPRSAEPSDGGPQLFALPHRTKNSCDRPAASAPAIPGSVLDRERTVNLSISSSVIVNSITRRHPAMIPLLVLPIANKESAIKSSVPRRRFHGIDRLVRILRLTAMELGAPLRGELIAQAAEN